MSTENALKTENPPLGGFALGGVDVPCFDYFRAFVAFPDGKTERIRSIYFGDAGSPYRITTAPTEQWGPFHEIEGDDLRRVKVSIVGHLVSRK